MLKEGVMEISLLKVLLDNISSFYHLSSCVNINSEPVLKYYQRAEEILKLFKTILDAFIDSEAASTEVLKKSFEELGCFIDDLREQFVNWHPLSSKVYFVLQIESLLSKIRSSSLDIFQLLKSSHQVLPDELDSVSLEAKRMPMVTQVHRGSFSQGSWIGEMQQASDKSVIISEILDPRTKNLLAMSKISDYVLSNELVSMALAMVAEDRQINNVLEELFAEEGNELQIRQADLYLREGEELSFYEINLRARQRREIVIGYRLANAERAVINPPSKSNRQSWSVKDVFVVIAEKE